MNAVVSSGIKLAYSEDGTGGTIVLIRGSGMTQGA